MQDHLGLNSIRIICMLTLILHVAVGITQDFPEGEGRDQILFACTGCHGLDNITNPHKPLTAEEWEIYLYDMVVKGANLTIDEIEPVKRYLIENFAVDKN